MTTTSDATDALSPDRILGIGGSEAAAVLGLSPWKTPYQVWRDKVGLSEAQEQTEPQKWGLLLEPLVRQEYANRTGRTIRKVGHIQSKAYPFMLCTPDGVTDDRRVVEVKTARWPTGWGEEGTDEIPTPYLIQCQHNMYVAEMEVADVPVLIGGNDFRIYEVPADPEVQKMLIEGEAKFWGMVEAKTPPPPISFADAIRQFAVSKAATVTATPEVIAAVDALREVKAAAKAAKEREETAKFTILSVLREADTLQDTEGNTLLTYKSSKESRRFNAKALQEEHPDLYEEFLMVTPGSRRLLLKGANDSDE